MISLCYACLLKPGVPLTSSSDSEDDIEAPLLSGDVYTHPFDRVRIQEPVQVVASAKQRDSLAKPISESPNIHKQTRPCHKQNPHQHVQSPAEPRITTRSPVFSPYKYFPTLPPHQPVKSQLHSLNSSPTSK
ncbi:hypothetical protein CFP56_013050 [Quercus suber]|uniref:Uncharacterized protein n=1 Tax=Quercus suber TaxID=58331 RepID=A0AAW0M458_QUESU